MRFDQWALVFFYDRDDHSPIAFKAKGFKQAI